MVFTYPCKFGWLRTIHPKAWWQGEESHQWLKRSDSVSTRMEPESEQLCSRQAEGRAVMALL